MDNISQNFKVNCTTSDLLDCHSTWSPSSRCPRLVKHLFFVPADRALKVSLSLYLYHHNLPLHICEKRQDIANRASVKISHYVCTVFQHDITNMTSMTNMTIQLFNFASSFLVHTQWGAYNLVDNVKQCLSCTQLMELEREYSISLWRECFLEPINLSLGILDIPSEVFIRVRMPGQFFPLFHFSHLLFSTFSFFLFSSSFIHKFVFRPRTEPTWMATTLVSTCAVRTLLAEFSAEKLKHTS